MKNIVLHLAACAIITWGLAIPAHAVAAESNNSDEWKLLTVRFICGALPSGKRPRQAGDIDMSFNEILEHLDMAFMGEIGACKGKWSLFTDLVYMKESDHAGGGISVPYGGSVVPVDVNEKIKPTSSILTAAGGYNLIQTDEIRLDALADIRYFSTDVDLYVNASALGQSASKKLSDSENLLDAIIGVKGYAQLGGTGHSSATLMSVADNQS